MPLNKGHRISIPDRARMLTLFAKSLCCADFGIYRNRTFDISQHSAPQAVEMIWVGSEVLIIWINQHINSIPQQKPPEQTIVYTAISTLCPALPRSTCLLRLRVFNQHPLQQQQHQQISPNNNTNSQTTIITPKININQQSQTPVRFPINKYILWLGGRTHNNRNKLQFCGRHFALETQDHRSAPGLAVNYADVLGQTAGLHLEFAGRRDALERRRAVRHLVDR